jgi:hypothetical protein
MSATKRRRVRHWLAALAASGALGASVVASFVSPPSKMQLLFLFLAMIFALLTVAPSEVTQTKALAKVPILKKIPQNQSVNYIAVICS